MGHVNHLKREGVKFGSEWGLQAGCADQGQKGENRKRWGTNMKNFRPQVVNPPRRPKKKERKAYFDEKRYKMAGGFGKEVRHCEKMVSRERANSAKQKSKKKKEMGGVFFCLQRGKRVSKRRQFGL